MNSSSPPLPSTIDPSDTSSHSDSILVGVSCMVAFAFPVFLLRLYTRIFVTRYFGKDDWLMLAAVVVFLAVVGISLAGLPLGVGQHIWTIPRGNLVHIFRLYYYVQILYPLGSGLIKLSIIEFYRRLFASPTMLRILNILAAYIVVTSTAFLIASILQFPPSGSNLAPPTASESLNRQVVNYLLGSSSIITDLVVMILPMRSFWKLRVPIKERIVVIFVFAIGSIACVAAVGRMVAARDLASDDATYDLYTITLWSTAEFALGIACGSVPGLKPLVVKLSDKMRTSSNTGSELSEIPVRFQTSDRSNLTARTRDSIVTVDGA